MSLVRKWPVIVPCFLISSLAAGLALAACDSTTPSSAGAVPTTSMWGGQVVYARYCNACHPGGGRGAGPSLIGLPLSDAQMQDVVRHGKNRMPAFSPDLIPDPQLADLVSYIRALK